MPNQVELSAHFTTKHGMDEKFRIVDIFDMDAYHYIKLVSLRGEGALICAWMESVLFEPGGFLKKDIVTDFTI